MDYVIERFDSWMIFEPFVGILMIISSAILFVSHFNKNKIEHPSLSQWIGRVIESFAVAMAFMFILWAFRSLLSDNTEGFAGSHGRVSEANYYSVQTIWGSPHHQTEMMLSHFAPREVEEEVGTDAMGRAIFRTVKKDVFITGLNPIVASSGKAQLKLNERKKGSAFYSGYNLKFKITYSCKNPLDENTKGYFVFRLPDQVMYDSIKVFENANDLSGKFGVGNGAITWQRPFQPQEVVVVEISYLSRGLDSFYYVVEEQREINNFDFTIEIDRLEMQDVNYPENCLTPGSVAATPDGNGTILSWKLNNAITTSGMGVQIEQPEQPGAEVIRVLRNSPYALMMLITTVCITLLIFGYKVNFLEISLLSAVYCILFISMASLSDYAVGFWGSLIVGGIISIGMTYVLYRNNPSPFLRNSILTLVIFFTMVYPLSALFPAFEENFKSWVIIALIIYVFVISTRSRVLNKTIS